MQKFYEINIDSEPSKEIDNVDIAKIALAHVNSFVNNDYYELLGVHGLSHGISIIISDIDGNFVLGHFLDNFNVNVYDMLGGLNTHHPLRVMVIPGAVATMESVNDILVFLGNITNMVLYQFETDIVNLGNFIVDGKIDFAINTKTLEFLKPNYEAINMKGRI